MKNKIQFISIAMIVLSLDCLAQESSSKDSSCIGLKDFKNKVGINVAPLAGVFLNGESGSYSTFALHYWRRINKRFAFHISPKYSLANVYEAKDSIVAATDTSYISKHMWKNEHNKSRLNIGLQYSWGSGVLSYFASLDLYYAFNKSEYSERYKYYKLMKKNDQELLYYNQGNSLDGINFEHVPQFEKMTVNNFIGLNPGIGMKVNLTQHFSLIVQSLLDFAFVTSNITEYRSGQLTRNYKNNFFDADMPSLVSDLSVCYKF